MTQAFPRKEVLRDFLIDALSLEKAYEGEALWTIYRSLPEEGYEDLKDLVFDTKIRSTAHYYAFLDIAEELGIELEPGELDLSLDGESLLKEGMELEEVLKKLRHHEETSRDFYARLASSIEETEFEETDKEDILERLERIVEEEKRHADGYGEALKALEGEDGENRQVGAGK